MSDSIAKKIISGEVINSIFIVFTKPVVLIAALLIARYLTLYEYGTYKLIMTSYFLLSGFSANFLDNLILNEMNVFHGNQEENKTRRIFNEYFFVKIAVGICLSSLVFLCSGLIGKYYVDDISNWIKIIALLFLMENIKNVMLMFFQYKLKFFISSFFVFALELSKLICVILAYNFFSLGISGVIFSIVLSNSLIVVFFSPIFIKYYKKDKFLSSISLVNKFLLLETLLHYGRWVIIRSYFINFVQNIRPWIIKFFLGTESVAIFSIASDFVENIKSLVSFNSLKVFLPRKINNKKDLIKMYALGSKYATYFYIIMTMASIIIIPILIKLFIPKYSDSLPYFYIIIFSTIFFGVSSISNKVIYALRKQKELIFIPLSNAVFILIFNFLLTPFFGLYGVSIELLINQILVCLISYFLVIKYRPELKLLWVDFIPNQYDKNLIGKIILFFKINFSWLNINIGKKSKKCQIDSE